MCLFQESGSQDPCILYGIWNHVSLGPYKCLSASQPLIWTELPWIKRKSIVNEKWVLYDYVAR